MSTNPENLGDDCEDEEAEDVGSNQSSTNGNNGHDVNTPSQPTRNVNNGLNVGTPPQPVQICDNSSDSSPLQYFQIGDISSDSSPPQPFQIGDNGSDSSPPLYFQIGDNSSDSSPPQPFQNGDNGSDSGPPQPFQNGNKGSDSGPPQPTIREGGSNVAAPLSKRAKNLGNQHTLLTKGVPKFRKRPTPLLPCRPKPENQLTPAINSVSKPEKPPQIGTQPKSFLNGNSDPALGTPPQPLQTNGNSSRDIGAPLAWYSGPSDGTPRLPFQTNGNSGRDIGGPPESFLNRNSGQSDGTPRLPFQTNGNSGRDIGGPPESFLNRNSGPSDGTPRLPFQTNGNSGRDIGGPPESFLNRNSGPSDGTPRLPFQTNGNSGRDIGAPLAWYSGPSDGTPRLPFQTNGNSGRDIGAPLAWYSGPSDGTPRLPFQTNGNSGRDIGAPPDSFLNGNRGSNVGGSLGSSSNRNRCPVGPYQSSIGGRRPNVVDPFELLYAPQIGRERGPRSLSPSSSLSYISNRLNADDQRTIANVETGVNGQYTTSRNIEPTGSNRYMILDHIGNRVAGNLGTGANFGGHAPQYNHVAGNVNRTPSNMSVTTHLIQAPVRNSSNNTPIDYSIRFAPLPPRYPHMNAGTTGVGTSTAVPHVASSSLVREYIHHQVPDRSGYNIPNSRNGGLTSQEFRAVPMRHNLIQVPAYRVGDVGPSTSGSYLQNRSDPLSRSGNLHNYNVVWNPNVYMANSVGQRAPAATATATAPSDPENPQLSYSEERPDEEENSTE